MANNPSIDELSRILGKIEQSIKNANYRLNDLKKWLGNIDSRLDEISERVKVLEEWRLSCEKAEQRKWKLIGAVLALMNTAWAVVIWLLEHA